MRILDDAVQIHGGYGYMWETEINRLYRAGKLLEIGAGTNEVRRLIIAELALAQTLLIVAGLVIHSFSLLVTADPGFEATNLLTARISLPEERYPELSQRDEFFHRLLERVRALPGAISATVAGPIPLDPKAGWQNGYHVEGEPIPEPGKGPLLEVFAVSDDYFTTSRGSTAGPRPGDRLW